MMNVSGVQDSIISRSCANSDWVMNQCCSNITDRKLLSVSKLVSFSWGGVTDRVNIRGVYQ